MAAERVALAVYGVKGLANDLAIHLPNLFQRTDTEIAQAAAAALGWNVLIPKDRVTVTVTDGWLTCTAPSTGSTRRTRPPAPSATSPASKASPTGSSSNRVSRPTDVRTQIEAAFKRSAEIDARRINIAATDGTVDAERQRPFLGGTPAGRACRVGRPGCRAG